MERRLNRTKIPITEVKFYSFNNNIYLFNIFNSRIPVDININ